MTASVQIHKYLIRARVLLEGTNGARTLHVYRGPSFAVPLTALRTCLTGPTSSSYGMTSRSLSERRWTRSTTWRAPRLLFTTSTTPSRPLRYAQQAIATHAPAFRPDEMYANFKTQYEYSCPVRPGAVQLATLFCTSRGVQLIICFVPRRAVTDVSWSTF